MDVETFPDLSPRETQLLLMASDGLTDNAISLKLGISVATVNSYWVRIRSKLGAQSRTEAVAMALRTQAEANMRKLQAENERLAQELAAANQSESSGAMSGQSFADLIQAAPDGILIVGTSGKIIACNPAVADMFGYRSEDMVGQLVSKLIPGRLRETHMDHINEYFSAPSRRRMGHDLFTPGLRKDGSEFAVSITLGATDTSAGHYTVCMIRDATAEMDAIAQHMPHLREAVFADGAND